MKKLSSIIYPKSRKLLVVATLAGLVACTASAQEIFRALSYGVGLYQSYDLDTKPVYSEQPIAGHDLVSAALGLSFTNVSTNIVQALTVDCESSNISLVAYDLATSNIVATLATSTSVTVVQEDNKDTASPNRERYVAQLTVANTNNLAGGFLTLAGRFWLNPTNGCPRAIRTTSDNLDKIFEDFNSQNLDDKKDHDVMRAGIGHEVGVVNFLNGTNTTTVILPYVGVSVRRELPNPPPPITRTPSKDRGRS